MTRSVRHRLAGAALAAAALTALPVMLGPAPAQAASQDIVSVASSQKDGYRQQILSEINAYRTARGLKPVRYSSTITGIAQDESDRVVRAEYVSHSLNFVSDPRRGAGVDAMNEITALEYSINPKALVTWWKNSPDHNKVLLSPKIDVIGIGVTIADGNLARTGQPWRIVSVVDGYGYASGYGPSDARSSVTSSTTTAKPTTSSAVKPQATRKTVPAGPFADVPGDYPFASEISWAKSKGLLTGWSDGTFRPTQNIDRNAMAAVAYRMAGSPAYTPPKVSPYKDVSPSSAFYKEITWARSQGLLTGWSDGTFRPLNDIDRNATAALLYRMSGSPAYTAPKTSSFKDVRPGSAFYKEIHWMSAQGITTGWNDGTFRPLDQTHRDAMAAFLQRYSS
ncbi:CAP and S-layer homology domain-containing protein [Kocuria palustris]|jgi:uncharacterized protein YkwD|uniref:CAP and S-layer homology domain-containing protein n=1 Tax=Kocuria palustris TaxID=71999 RepID=UPI001F154072|nr:S-layer homology domain-containing protein [Kocuria palustris]